jgi:hypothetical protein
MRLLGAATLIATRFGTPTGENKWARGPAAAIDAPEVAAMTVHTFEKARVLVVRTQGLIVHD